jgi:hypothetical protein
VLTEPRQDPYRIRVNPHSPIPTLLLGIENFVQQVLRQIETCPAPRSSVNVLIGHLILAWALDVLFERHQHVAHERIGRGRGFPQYLLDARAKTFEHREQVFCRVGEGDERAAVIEQDRVNEHPHILSAWPSRNA